MSKDIACTVFPSLHPHFPLESETVPRTDRVRSNSADIAFLDHITS